MINPKALTTDELHGLLADCLSGTSGNKPTISEPFLRDGLTTSLHEDGPSIEVVRQLYAAGLLTFGDLSMVDVILDNMLPNGPSGAGNGLLHRRGLDRPVCAAATP